jgi:hypothetical protein
MPGFFVGDANKASKSHISCVNLHEEKIPATFSKVLAPAKSL